ncbi:hypothetical protein Q8A67_020376 [Cirrhinus molitorella]|uniref:Uncharacterized protein n=1 Tax=Cirrhinus molitorella TaxID=172907 RepID=A0AA88PJG0_9TELE|nr:hypothetical protein Q8A67_020376 [Cirrhinus molitorella]
MSTNFHTLRHAFLHIALDSLAQRGLQTQPVPLAAQLLTLSPVYVDKGGIVAPAQADGSKRALLSQPTISLKGSGPSHRAWVASASVHPPAGLRTAESGHSKAEVRLYRMSSVAQFTETLKELLL